MDEGLVKIFLDAGAAISTSTCGPCIGGHMGVLADGEVCVSTSSRNFVGRMGHRGSKVYLSNAAVAAAAAGAGELVHSGEGVRETVPGERARRVAGTRGKWGIASAPTGSSPPGT